MSSVFESITFTYGGQDYTVPATKVMGLIAAIEEIITFGQLNAPSGPPLSKLAAAYAAALRYAGAERVDVESVYESLFSEGGAGTRVAMSALMSLMIPPSSIVGATEKKAEPPGTGDQ